MYTKFQSLHENRKPLASSNIFFSIKHLKWKFGNCRCLYVRQNFLDDKFVNSHFQLKFFKHITFERFGRFCNQFLECSVYLCPWNMAEDSQWSYFFTGIVRNSFSMPIIDRVDVCAGVFLRCFFAIILWTLGIFISYMRIREDKISWNW